MVDIGFIGLGHMGFPMARRLIDAGYDVVAFDTRTEALDRLVALGARPASSPKEVADVAETVLASRRPGPPVWSRAAGCAATSTCRRSAAPPRYRSTASSPNAISSQSTAR